MLLSMAGEEVLLHDWLEVGALPESGPCLSPWRNTLSDWFKMATNSRRSIQVACEKYYCQPSMVIAGNKHNPRLSVLKAEGLHHAHICVCTTLAGFGSLQDLQYRSSDERVMSSNPCHAQQTVGCWHAVVGITSSIIFLSAAASDIHKRLIQSTLHCMLAP